MHRTLKAELDDEQLRALGRVTASFALLDFHARIVLARLLGGQETTARTLVIDEPLGWVLRKIGTLKVFVSSELREAIEGWLASARSAQARRNDVIHSLWFVSTTGDETTKGALHKLSFGARKGPVKFDLDEVSASELEDLVEEIDRVSFSAGEISMQLVAADPPPTTEVSPQ